MATLCAIDLSINQLDKNIGPTKHVTVASPRVGETHFEKLYSDMNMPFTRLVLKHDPIPSVPFGFGYTHIGEEFHLEVAQETGSIVSITFFRSFKIFEPLKKDDSGLSTAVPHGIKHYLKSILELADKRSYEQWSYAS